MHLVMFQVLDRQPFTSVGGDDRADRARRPPPAASEAGWKDTVQVAPERDRARDRALRGLRGHVPVPLPHPRARGPRDDAAVPDGFLRRRRARSRRDLRQRGRQRHAGILLQRYVRVEARGDRLSGRRRECDPAETCSGSSAVCPADAVSPAGTPCSGDGDVCTDDACDGVGACAHVFDPGNDPSCEPPRRPRRPSSRSRRRRSRPPNSAATRTEAATSPPATR